MVKNNIKVSVLVGVLSALSAVLMFFPHFPIIPASPWLEVDFSDVPALLASITISPYVGVLVVVVKNFVHLAFTSTAFIGELSNLIIGCCFVFTAGMINKYALKKLPVKKRLLVVLPIASLAQVFAAVCTNYFIMVPLYSSFVDFNSIGGVGFYIYGCVIPFNIIKDFIVCLVFYLLHSYLFQRIKKSLL